MAKDRTCTKCGKTKSLDAEHFRRDKYSPEGFNRQCKPCSAALVKTHFRRWQVKDRKERGETGVRCILYSKELCQVCPCPSVEELELCRRLEGTSPEYDDFPDPLPQ